MCRANDLPLSLKSDTFNALCSDFDQIIRSTLSGMEETEQDVAEVNVKVKITLTPSSAPDFSVAGGQQTRSITKPKFDHTVSAVIQKKEKKTGTLSGNYELVWDRESCCYVMRPILDEIGYDLEDIVDDLLAEGIKPTLNAITSEVFSKGVEELKQYISDRLCEPDVGDGKEIQEVLRELDPERDIEWFCNCLDTRVWFRQNGSIYRRYLSSALDSFEDNVGFSLTGGEGDDN